MGLVGWLFVGFCCVFCLLWVVVYLLFDSFCCGGGGGFFVCFLKVSWLVRGI